MRQGGTEGTGDGRGNKKGDIQPMKIGKIEGIASEAEE